MIKSKHNIVSQIAGTENYFIVNLLSGEADILTPEDFSDYCSDDALTTTHFIEKGYVVDEQEENRLYKQKYLEFIDTREKDEVQLFFVPTYMCNFNCAYCYQDEYGHTDYKLQDEISDAFFKYVENTFAGRNKYITIFGGEPLLGSEQHKNYIQSLLNKAKNRGLEVAIVTNGYNLNDYIPILKSALIREVQVTVDGVGETHDKRRPLKGGGSTFENIIEGVDALLQNKINVNLRLVIDKENIEELPKLSKFAIERGWTKSPCFKTQLGRNYELHHCQSQSNRLYTRIEMYKDIFELLKAHPYISEFHKPAFSVSKFLFEQGELPSPLFDSCPGTKTEWAFDYTGKIYSCTATVGKNGEELGSFYPNVNLNIDKVEQWEERDVLAIEQCADCSLQLACGGGCGSVSKNNNGKICSTDCRPVKELLELGIAHYFAE